MPERILNLSPDSREWSEQFNTSQEMWDACTRGDWLLFHIAEHCGPANSSKRKVLLKIASECLRINWSTIKNKDSKDAIIASEDWERGLVNKTELETYLIKAQAERDDTSGKTEWENDMSWSVWAVINLAFSEALGVIGDDIAEIVSNDYEKEVSGSQEKIHAMYAGMIKDIYPLEADVVHNPSRIAAYIYDGGSNIRKYYDRNTDEPHQLMYDKLKRTGYVETFYLVKNLITGESFFISEVGFRKRFYRNWYRRWF